MTTSVKIKQDFLVEFHFLSPYSDHYICTQMSPFNMVASFFTINPLVQRGAQIIQLVIDK